MCDLGYIVKDHNPAEKQLLTNELREYNMQMITTKCLNTAVMMMYLMLGADALKTTRYCDVEDVVDRFVKGHDPPVSSIVDALVRDMGRRDTGRDQLHLFYIMITDGEMKRAVKPVGGNHRASEPVAYFPGHVFVIEKLPRGTFNMYQSYINHYDLEKHIDANGSLSVGYNRMMQLMRGLQSMMKKRVWDKECTRFWMDLTNTPESHAAQFEGYTIKDTLLLCYKVVHTQRCVTQLKDMVRNKLSELSKLPAQLRNMVYGDKKLYRKPSKPTDSKPLTNGEMIENLKQLMNKLW